MAYAPHTNTDFAHGQDVPLLLGSFREAEYGHTFEYAVRPNDGVDFAPDAPHIIYVGGAVGDRTRYAKVLKTVAWVATDEDAEGQPVWQKWAIKEHHNYDTAWAVGQRNRQEA